MLDGPVAWAVGGLQMASPESAYIFAMVWAHSVLLLFRDGLRGPLEDWLELCPEGSGEVVRRHPLLASM